MGIENKTTAQKRGKTDSDIFCLLSSAYIEISQARDVPTILQTVVPLAVKFVTADAGSAGQFIHGDMVYSDYYHAGQWHTLETSSADCDETSESKNNCIHLCLPFSNSTDCIQINTDIQIPITDAVGNQFGCIRVCRSETSTSFDEQDKKLLDNLADIAGLAITGLLHNKPLHDENRALLKSEDRYIRSQRFANIGTWDWNIQTGDLYWSEQIAALFGYEIGELETTYENFLAAVHPEDRQDVIDAVNACLESGSEYEIEHRVVWPDNSVYWVLERGDVVRDSTGKPLHMLGVVQDITLRKEAERELRRERDLAQGIIETAQAIVLILDTEGNIVSFNPYMEKISGYQLAEVKNRNWFDTFIPEYERNRIKHVFGCAIDNIQTRGNINKIITKSGEFRDIEWYDTTLRDPDGKVIGLLALGQDITGQLQVDDELRLAAMVIDNTPEGVMITDAQLRIVSVNPAFVSTTGYQAEDVIGKMPNVLSSGRHDTSFYSSMWAEISEHGSWQGEIWNRRKDGEIYPEWLNISTIKNNDGEVTNYAGIFSDISTQEHVRKRLHNLAYYDALTELPNRELFLDRLNNSIIQSRRTDQCVALMFLDLDRFKNVNDSLGHRSGDKLLRVVAEKLLAAVRDGDTVARLGGDEFTIILPGINKPSDAANVAGKIVKDFSGPFHLDSGQEIYASASIGISLCPTDADNAEALIKYADTAMYRAKEAGRNNYQFYTAEMSKRFSERLLLESELRKAVEHGELSLHYQPQIALMTGRITGLEALLRWDNPRYGWISPLEFIPIAEECGLIHRIGDWVLQTACEQASRWQAQSDSRFRIAVNVSAHQFHKVGLIETVETILSNSGLGAEYLELELTESILMENAETTIHALSAFNEAGIQLAIDDFGTGYSSLSYLKRFDIDNLKIDQSFVQDISTDRNDAEIVSTIIAMAKNLKLRVIAEGVETIEQLSFLQRNGCDEIQGYLFSKPVPAGDITTMIGRRDNFQAIIDKLP